MTFAAILAAFLPFSAQVTPEIRTTYLSLGKIVEDRPMQITSVKAYFGLGDFGKIGFRNWDVSSLTPRRGDVHRRALYHTEYGPSWQHGLDIADDWRLNSELNCSWTVYRGFENTDSNKTYWWWQIEQSLANPYLTPYYVLRRCVSGSDYLYCRLGVRRSFPIWSSLSITPALAIDGGSNRNQVRVFGRQADGSSVGTGFYTISPRLELSWKFTGNFTAFIFIEQYEVLGHSAREANRNLNYRCAHNDWTHGGIGLRCSF